MKTCLIILLGCLAFTQLCAQQNEAGKWLQEIESRFSGNYSYALKIKPDSSFYEKSELPETIEVQIAKVNNCVVYADAAGDAVLLPPYRFQVDRDEKIIYVSAAEKKAGNMPVMEPVLRNNFVFVSANGSKSLWKAKNYPSTTITYDLSGGSAFWSEVIYGEKDTRSAIITTFREIPIAPAERMCRDFSFYKGKATDLQTAFPGYQIEKGL